MAASTVIKHLYDGSIQLKDGTGTPVTLTVPFSRGDLSISGLHQTQKNVTAYETRGTLHSVRYTSRTYPTGSFSFMIADYSHATNNTAIDFVMKSNSYSANVTTLTSPAEVYAIDIVLTVEGSNFNDEGGDHTITLTKCVCTMDVAEGEPNAATLNFTCYGSVAFA